MAFPRLLAFALGVGVCGVHLSHAQSASPAQFEAASIKPNVSNAIGRRIGVPRDRFVAKNEPLRELIEVAYGSPGPLPQPLPHYQIAGYEGWINSDRFDVEAEAGGDVVRGTEGTRRKQLMLQTLLAERFKLVVHHETRQLPTIYLFVFARREMAAMGSSSLGRMGRTDDQRAGRVGIASTR